MGFEEDGIAQTMLRDYLILAISLLTMMKSEKQRTALGFPRLISQVWQLEKTTTKTNSSVLQSKYIRYESGKRINKL